MHASTPYYQASGNATAQLVKTGYTLLHSWEVENPNSSATHGQLYLQLFDAAATTDVTVGTTTPDQTYKIDPGDGTTNGGGSKHYEAPLRFSKGLVWAITTTRSGSTGPTTACPTNITYE